MHATACAPAESSEAASSEDELKRLPASSVLGTMAYGESKTLTVATSSYRALAFDGSAGDQVEASIAASAAKLDGLWIVDDTFANVGYALGTTSTARLSASAKLAKTGKHYLVFRQRTSSPITHQITLDRAVGVPSVGLTPGRAFATDPDGYARLSFPARAGDRFRIVVGSIDETFGTASAELQGCAGQALSFGHYDYARGINDVTIAKTGMCIVKAGNSQPGATRPVYLALIRLDDPERQSYLKALECDGPAVPLDALAAALPAGSSSLVIRPRDGLRGRERSCDPATGCSPYTPIVAQPPGHTGYAYRLSVTDAGLQLGVVDDQGYGYTKPAGGDLMPYTHEGETVRVRISKGCLSLASDAPDVYGQDHVVRFDLPDAPRPAEVPPALPSECTGTPLNDAQVLALFAPGASDRVVPAPTTSVSRACNLSTGCAAWGAPSTSTATSLELRLDGTGHAGVVLSPTQTLAVSKGRILSSSGEPVGKVTAGCVDLTLDSSPPAHGTANHDGTWNQTRRRQVGSL